MNFESVVSNNNMGGNMNQNQNQNQNQKKGKKSVSFFQNVRVLTTLHLNDYTLKEIERCYYDCEFDIHEFKENAKLDALRLKEYSSGTIFYNTRKGSSMIVDGDFCSRGIEYFTIEGSFERRERRRNSINIVLQKQQKMEQEEDDGASENEADVVDGIDRHVFIAKEYSKAVSESVAIARDLGISDEIDARFIYRENKMEQHQLKNKKKMMMNCNNCFDVNVVHHQNKQPPLLRSIVAFPPNTARKTTHHHHIQHHKKKKRTSIIRVHSS